MIFDTHAHYDDEAFDEDRDAVLSSLQEKGVGTVVNICVSPASLKRIRELTEAYPFVYGAAGIHPDHAGELTEEMFEEISRLADEEKIIAEVKRDCEHAKIDDIRGVNLACAGSINNGSLLTSMRTVMAAIQNYGRY